MSTHIHIGQPKIEVTDNGDVWIVIEDAESPAGATPPFMASYTFEDNKFVNGDPTPEPTNHVMIATLDYLGTLKRVGLDDLFHGDEDNSESGFDRSPDGPHTTKLTHDHLTRFEAALERHKEQYPDLLGDIGLLTWLIYWTRWALETCAIPAIWVF